MPTEPRTSTFDPKEGPALVRPPGSTVAFQPVLAPLRPGKRPAKQLFHDRSRDASIGVARRRRHAAVRTGVAWLARRALRRGPSARLTHRYTRGGACITAGRCRRRRHHGWRCPGFCRPPGRRRLRAAVRLRSSHSRRRRGQVGQEVDRLRTGAARCTERRRECEGRRENAPPRPPPDQGWSALALASMRLASALPKPCGYPPR
jgi:hypothetical protein